MHLQELNLQSVGYEFFAVLGLIIKLEISGCAYGYCSRHERTFGKAKWPGAQSPPSTVSYYKNLGCGSNE